MNREAEAEAWVRKPKRIIHNQTLIQLLMIVAIVTPMPLSALLLWSVLTFYPRITMPTILVAWFALAFGYSCLRIYYRNRR